MTLFVVVLVLSRLLYKVETSLHFVRNAVQLSLLLQHFNHFFLAPLVSEVPATKLAALQKVLQSEFLNAVREVRGGETK